MAWLATVVVAVVVALAVPVSQLRTVSIIRTCCCPDPDSCHCPDHTPDSSTQPSMRACHNSERAIVAPELPAFQAPAVAIVATPALVVIALEHAVVTPHPAPPLNRPDAPS
ncbi:MAG: hypothetical protein ABIY55_09970 [Kofleriaceae bacterium]